MGRCNPTGLYWMFTEDICCCGRTAQQKWGCDSSTNKQLLLSNKSCLLILPLHTHYYPTHFISSAMGKVEFSWIVCAPGSLGFLVEFPLKFKFSFFYSKNWLISVQCTMHNIILLAFFFHFWLKTCLITQQECPTLS